MPAPKEKPESVKPNLRTREAIVHLDRVAVLAATAVPEAAASPGSSGVRVGEVFGFFLDH